MRSKVDLYSNHYESRYLVLILSVLLLNILDAHFTFSILQMGGMELNPVMTYLLEKNVALSLVLKYVVTASGLIFFLIHKDRKVFGNLRVSGLIYFVFFLYVILVLTEAYAYTTLLQIHRGWVF